MTPKAIILLLATAAMALTTPSEGSLEKRTSHSFSLTNYKKDGCGTGTGTVSVVANQCMEINNAPTLSFKAYDPGFQTCVINFYEGANCGGRSASYYYVSKVTGDGCETSVKQSGGVAPLSGASSFMVFCSVDKMPGSA